MRVCLTVQGEQPINAATRRMPSGGPRGGDGPTLASCARTLGPRWGGQWLGQGCPRGRPRKGRKYAGLRNLGPRRFGAEDELPFVLGFGSLVAMVVTTGSVK
jgi:hypothetical protein